MDAENKKGIGLAALVAIIVSGAIGGGVFNLSNDLATNASPGGVIISWIVIGFGILMLVLSLNHLMHIRKMFHDKKYHTILIPYNQHIQHQKFHV